MCLNYSFRLCKRLCDLVPSCVSETCVWVVQPSNCRPESQHSYRDLGNHSNLPHVTVQMRLKTKHLHFVLISTAGIAFMRQVILFYHDNISCSKWRHIAFALTAFPIYQKSFQWAPTHIPSEQEPGQIACSPDTNTMHLFPTPKKRLKKITQVICLEKPQYFVSHKLELKVSDQCEHWWSLQGSNHSCAVGKYRFMSTSSLWALFLLEARAHCPLRDDEAITLSGIFYSDNEPSSGCSCRRVFAYSHQKLKAPKVTTLEAMRQPALWFTLFEHLLQFSVKNVLQKYCTEIYCTDIYKKCLHRTAVKISWTCKGRGKKCANL